MCGKTEGKGTHDEPFAGLRPVEGVLGVALLELDEEDFATVELLAVLQGFLTLLDVLADGEYGSRQTFDFKSRTAGNCRERERRRKTKRRETHMSTDSGSERRATGRGLNACDVHTKTGERKGKEEGREARNKRVKVEAVAMGRKASDVDSERTKAKVWNSGIEGKSTVPTSSKVHSTERLRENGNETSLQQRRDDDQLHE
jgi:hypothetical protein